MVDENALARGKPELADPCETRKKTGTLRLCSGQAGVPCPYNKKATPSGCGTAKFRFEWGWGLENPPGRELRRCEIRRG